MNPAPLNIHSAVPVISTDDIRSSINYYINVLGFSPDFEFGDPLVYAGVRSGDAEIYFTHDPDFFRLINERHVHPEIFIWSSNVDGLFNMHATNGAKIIEPILDRAWGARQYVVQEINGYHLKFAEPALEV